MDEQWITLASKQVHAYLAGMDQTSITAPLPAEWADSIARDEADLAAGRIQEIDVAALRREIEAEANGMLREIARKDL